ncbi:MAG: hypothetical protein ACK5Q5_14400, partial [Planctomycetaceae bacterium]
MDAQTKTRRVHRERSAAPEQPLRGAKQIVLPMTRQLYDELWPHPERLRTFVDALADESPELF